MQYDRWQWHKDFLTCDLLAEWRHGFFSRAVHPQTPKELHRYLAGSGTAKTVKQVHGVTIVCSDTIQQEPVLADGLWSNGQEQSIWVCSADCVPILIGDRRLGTVMAIHAGWRGTAGGILEVGLKILQAQGSCIPDLRIALGPAISGTVYQVQQDVAEQVTAILKQKTVGIVADEKPNHYLLDIRAVQRQFLLEMGIPSNHIAIAPFCTYQNAEYFFSYRRGDLQKVQWSGIIANDGASSVS
jgi:YfiH family protein